MGSPAARDTDLHICPKQITVTPFTPHGPGKIQAAGASMVFINKLAAAVKNDLCICIPEPGNMIQDGSKTVFIGKQPAARQGDPTTHQVGGSIQLGSTNVFIGG
jgi:uncharacterized Zn-binding protein involved in type VI secretion